MSCDQRQERSPEFLSRVLCSAPPSDTNQRQSESKSSLSKEEIKQRAEELCDTARDAVARAHQAADRTRHLVQKTDELFQHGRARQERETEQRSLHAMPGTSPLEISTSGLFPIEILLIEDNPGDVRLLQELLHEIAIPTHLQAVACGEEALALLRHEGTYRQAPHPHVILLDLHLPGMEGMEVFRKIKHDSALREIPVAVFTAIEAEKAQLAAAGPVTAYLTKTFTLDTTQYKELLEIIGPPRGDSTAVGES